MVKEKSAAIVTIFSAPAMTDEGRRAVAEWLREQAKGLIKYGKDYTTKRFTARYIYK